MRELNTEIVINAPADRVWKILTDLKQFSAWNPFITQAEGEIEEGARLRVHIEPPGGTAMTFKPTVTHVAPERELRWLGRLLLPGVFDGEHCFEMSPFEEGRTCASFSVSSSGACWCLSYGDVRSRALFSRHFSDTAPHVGHFFANRTALPVPRVSLATNTRRGFEAMNAALKEQAGCRKQNRRGRLDVYESRRPPRLV